MSKIIASAAIRAGNKIVAEADAMLEKAIKEKGPELKFEFTDTGYFMPMFFAITGIEVRTLGDMRKEIEHAKSLLTSEPIEKKYKPYLGEALDAGMATLLAQEIIMAVKYVNGLEPVEDKELGLTYNGFITDSILRDLGIQLVDGTMPGYVCIIGAAQDEDRAVKLARELQQKNILTFLCGNVKGNSMTKQLMKKGVELGWPTRLVPLGPDTSHAIYALNWAARAPLTFGGIKGGDFMKVLKYTKDRVFAFAMVLGELDDLKWATGAGAINMGFPALCDTDVPVVHPRGVTIYEEVEKELDQDKLVETAIMQRGLKIITHKVDIPVAFGPAFEGERIRKEDGFLEWGGGKTPAFELCVMRDIDKVQDGKITVIGEENKEKIEKGGQIPLGIIVEVAGRKMEKDFEPVVERKFHDFINEAQGVWQMGQRDIIWGRISKTAQSEGFRLHHLGTLLTTMTKSHYPAIIDRVQVTIYTDEKDILKHQEEAKKIFTERNERVSNMTDESVDTFYSCTLCQSFAPTHVCVISPERLGLCGAYNWLDTKASFQIDPTGPNQPIAKGECYDNVRGKWRGVDEFIVKASAGKVENFSAYSIMDNPMTSCGCFECILAVVPEANGIMIVHRGFNGMTPTGMKFSTMAGTVGGGIQTPGFMGVGRYFVISKKFLLADGGLKRIVWMTKDLKNSFKEQLSKRAAEEGVPDLLDKIADEDICTESDKLVEHLQKVKHPALEMPSIL